MCMNKLLIAFIFVFINTSFAQEAPKSNFHCIECTTPHQDSTQPLNLKNSQFMKNYFQIGALYSTAFKQGVYASYNLVNKKRNKTSFTIESTYTNSNDGLEGISLAINKHIGKRGLYIGGNAEVAKFKVDYIDTKPTVMIPFLGMQFGWKHFWDPNRRLASLVQVGIEGSQYQFKNLVMPEAKAGLIYRIGGGKVQRKK